MGGGSKGYKGTKGGRDVQVGRLVAAGLRG